MDRESLKQILESAYDDDKWRQVLRDVFGVRELRQRAEDITKKLNDKDRKLAEKAHEIVRFETSNGEVVGCFRVDLTEQPRIWQNRVGLRQLLRNVYKHDVDAALVVFVQPDQKKWRLSLVSEIRVFEESGWVERKTETKRYTYLLGEGEIARTTAEQLDSYRTSERSLDSLIKAFSVEKVTKDFFRDYKIVFDALQGEVDVSIADNAEARLFSQRLLNRLMFLYFIQRKGWMSYEGDQNYLRSVFGKAIANGENFYRDRLYWIFFYGLSLHAERIEIKSDEFLRERRGHVEYLNGGLFEMEVNDEKGKVNISNVRFAQVLELFERYNFTIDESTPFEVQIAVDPEMLGKVFEELVTGRHESGSYYTPRTVVSFMCREALKHSLAGIDNAEAIAALVDSNDGGRISRPEEVLARLGKLKVCDPACGSGAYLLGMLQELLHVREALFASERIDPEAQYKWKREIIENNIYGVDLDRFATQIAALRLWLSLAIESDTPHPLPNLKYKIGCGDSLLAPIETVGQGDLHRRALIEQFRARKQEYTDADSHEAKSAAEDEIEKLRVEIARILHHLPEPPSPAKLIFAKNQVASLEANVTKAVKEGPKAAAESAQKKLNDLLAEIARLEAQQSVAHYDSGNTFDWAVEFAEVFEDGGFDIVLANPPYLQLQSNGGFLAKLYERSEFDTFTRAGDIYSLFYERGFQLLKVDGVLSYITSNKWMRTKYGEKTRKFFTEKTRPLLIIDFGSVEVFSSATVDNNILILQKSRPDSAKVLWAVRTERDFDISQSLQSYVQRNGYYLPKVTENSWIIGEKDEFDIKGNVESQGVPLKHPSWSLAINRGILTGYNEAFIISGAIKKDIEARAKQNVNDKSSELLKPLLRGRDIKAWFPAFADLWLIHTHNGIKSKGINPVNVERDYRAIYEHLSRFQKRLVARQDKGDDWTNLRNCVYFDEFEKPKIIYPNMTKYLPFVYDEHGYYTNQKCYIITGKHLKYLACFFNSKLFKYCFSDAFPNLGEDRRELGKVYFEQIPVKKISEAQERPFNAMVDYITSLRKYIGERKASSSDSYTNIVMSSFFESLSDALILELYLSDDFDKHGISIKSHLPQLPGLETRDANSSIAIIKTVYSEIESLKHLLRANLSAMRSIPSVQVIHNAVRN